MNIKEYIYEAISNKNASRAATLISKYLTKKVGKKFWKLPGVEEFRNTQGHGYGVRLFISGTKRSIRFNWKDKNLNSSQLSSIDIWEGNKSDPNWRIVFDKDTSLVVILPFLANLLQTKIQSNDQFLIVPSESGRLDEIYDEDEVLVENWQDPFDSLLDGISKDPAYKGGTSNKEYQIYLTLSKMFPSYWQKQGRTPVFVGGAAEIKELMGAKDQFIKKSKSVVAKVTPGGTGETYKADAKTEEMNDNIERLPYEQQLKDLEALLKMMVKGASNAVFIAGRGGVGKTHMVEKVLAELGLRDGDGYFKNTGSASASGIYRLLFTHKDEIVLFDDSDDALKDQESRNIFKAATDTKKKRKLAWSKASSVFVEPDDLTQDEIDQGKLPRYFDFTGKIIFISNLPLDKLDPDKALRTRAFTPVIDPTNAEIFEFMEKIVDTIELEDNLQLSIEKRKKVVDWLKTSKSTQTPNLRMLVRGLNMAAGGEEAGVPESDYKNMIIRYA